MAANRSNIGWYLDNQIGGEDDRFTGRVYDKEVKLTSAQILALNATPVTLVAAPGLGKAIEFISAVYFLDHGGTDYDTGSDLVIRTAGGAAVSDIVPNTLINAIADATAVVRYGGGVAIVVNAGLTLNNVGAAHATGNGTLTVKVMYRIHDFN